MLIQCHTVSFLPLKADYVYKRFIPCYKKCMDRWHQGLQFTVLHPTWAQPGYIMFRGAWSCHAPAKADFLLGSSSALRCWWYFLAERVLPQLTSKMCGIQSLCPASCWGWYSRGCCCCYAVGFFSPYNNPLFTYLTWNMANVCRKFISILLILRESSVTKPNLGWREIDGWENLLGIVIFVTNTGFLISPFVYS